MHPDQGSNPQPGYVPSLGIKPTTLWCMGWRFNQRSHINQGRNSSLRPHDFLRQISPARYRAKNLCIPTGQLLVSILIIFKNVEASRGMEDNKKNGCLCPKCIGGWGGHYLGSSGTSIFWEYHASTPLSLEGARWSSYSSDFSIEREWRWLGDTVAIRWGRRGQNNKSNWKRGLRRSGGRKYARHTPPVGRGGSYTWDLHSLEMSSADPGRDITFPGNKTSGMVGMKKNLTWGMNLRPLAYHPSLQNCHSSTEGFPSQKGCVVLRRSRAVNSFT